MAGASAPAVFLGLGLAARTQEGRIAAPSGGTWFATPSPSTHLEPCYLQH
jgi:hypothetical protein